MVVRTFAILLMIFCVAATTQPASPPLDGRVAIVLDASASMNGVFTTARERLSAAVRSLADGQSFVVLVDASPTPKRFPASGYAVASEATRLAAEKFLNDDKLLARGDGRIDTIVTTACAMKPDVLLLGSDGNFVNDDKGGATNRIIAAGKANRVKIHTMLELSDGAGTPSARALAKVAESTGGVAGADTRAPASGGGATTRKGPTVFD